MNPITLTDDYLQRMKRELEQIQPACRAAPITAATAIALIDAL